MLAIKSVSAAEADVSALSCVWIQRRAKAALGAYWLVGKSRSTAWY